MPRTEAFLFGRDPIAGYTFGSTVTIPEEGVDEYTTLSRQMRYGAGPTTATDLLYVEPQKLSEYNAPGARSLDDLNRLIVFAQYTASGTTVGQCFVEFSRDDNTFEYAFNRFGPFPVGRWSISDAGLGPSLSVVDNPFPSDFMRADNTNMGIDDPLWCRVQVSAIGGSVAGAGLSIVVLLVNGSGAASQAGPHRGAFVSERRFW